MAARAVLVKRLATLPTAGAVADYRAEAADIRRAEGFQHALLRAKALSDERRLLTLSLIVRRGELCACELQAALDLSHATVSHHMACLLEAGLVTAEKRGKWTYYRATRAGAEAL